MTSNSRRKSMDAFSFRFTACLQSLFADESVPHDLSFFICGGTTFSPDVPGFPQLQPTGKERIEFVKIHGK